LWCSTPPPHAPPTGGVHVNQHRHVDVVLFLFVGLGFGVGFVAAIVVKWGQISRWFAALQEPQELECCWKVRSSPNEGN